MLSIFIIALYLACIPAVYTFVLPKRLFVTGWTYKLQSTATAQSSLPKVDYGEISNYLSEHIQRTDQMCLLGAQDDLALRLALDGYCQKKTGYLLVVSDNQQHIDAHLAIAQSDPTLSSLLSNQKLRYKHVDSYAKLGSVCKQSVFDSIVDNQALDRLLEAADVPAAMESIDHMQNSLRIGNILVCLSKKPKEVFCAPFEQRFGEYDVHVIIQYVQYLHGGM